MQDKTESTPGAHVGHGLSGERVDECIQTLYALGLRLEYCIALVDEAPEQAKAGMDSAISSLAALVNELRAGMGYLDT